MRNRLRVLVWCVAFASLAYPVSGQTIVDVKTAQTLANTLIAQGKPAAARDILAALVARDPENPALLINLSRAERSLGNGPQSIDAGRRAFRAATRKVDKFHAARVTAQAFSSNGQRTRAQIWLRRAGALAPNARAEAVIRSEYRYVRARNPISLAFSASVSPSNNINDAPVTNRLVLGPFVGVNPTARPISGIETTLSAGATLRLPSTQTTTNSFTVSYFGRRVALGSEAAEINPDLSDRDFRYDRVALSWSGRFKPSGQKGIYDASVQVFSDENGGAHFQNGQTIKFGYSRNILKNQSFRIGATLDLLDRTDRVARSSETLKVQGDWTIRLPNKDRLGVQLAVSDTHSESVIVAHSAQSMRVSYAFGKPILSTYFAVSAELRRAVFDDPAFVLLDTRRDERITFGATATFTDLDIFGFAPVLELRHVRNRSNIASFDSRATQIGLTLRSTY